MPAQRHLYNIYTNTVNWKIRVNLYVYVYVCQLVGGGEGGAG